MALHPYVPIPKYYRNVKLQKAEKRAEQTLKPREAGNLMRYLARVGYD